MLQTTGAKALFNGDFGGEIYSHTRMYGASLVRPAVAL